ncbi:HAD-IIIC family phosphatase [Actinomadura sp. 9N215]|uniref:HAD-IIIC family phosphatase n=1 Tax=Actinomadura sp. 9N215 TaxID=3375150 RepID=UPI00379B5E68
MNGSDARARLRALHRDGTLARRFDRVPPLLAAMDDDDLARSSRLLAGTDPALIREHHPGLPSVTVAITGHGTLDALRTALVGRLARHGYVPDVWLAGFDSYVFELGDPGSELYARRPGLTVCVLDHATVFDEVAIPFTVEDVERALAEKLALWRRLAARFAESGSGTLVLNTIPLPRFWQAQLLEHRARARLGAVWRSANAELLELGGATGGRVVVMDLDPLLTAAGVELSEPRLSTYAGAHLSAGLLDAYARELVHLVRAHTGRAKKVLALDLDETLWGGVLGDDGVAGIELGDVGRGPGFRRFQRVVKQLRSQGVLVAAVSKNDEEPVWTALREHPAMILREDDFVRVRADWKPKPGAIAELAGELNLGVESVVFADDSPHECAAVAAELPEVAVLHLDRDPAEHAETLLADGWFTVPEVTAEDRVRTTRYREEAARTEFLETAGAAEDFLTGLGVRVTLGRVGAGDLARVAQLTMRTNQFNLTAERLVQEEVRERAEGTRTRVLAIASADRFGPSGVVGAVFLRAGGDVLLIENFLLSCRVFGRGIEQACLSAVLARAAEAGFRAVRGRYRPTAKNGKVGRFFPHYGFAPDAVHTKDGTEDGTEDGTVYEHDLRDIVDVPEHLSLATEGEIVPAP